MTKITVNPDCGNSPKMIFLKKFNIAFAKGSVDFLIESVTDTITWSIIGDKKIEGKEKFTEVLELMKTQLVSELIVHQIVSHGKAGAVNGVLKMQNGKTYAFSDFYEFNSAKGLKIKSIASYVIQI